MGSFRYRNSVRVAPGVKLNLNRKSISVTGGVRGAHVTKSLGGRSSYSVGIPGTGLSYRGSAGRRTSGAGHTSLSKSLATAPPGSSSAKVGNFFVWLGGLVWLLPLAAIVAVIVASIHDFGVTYLLLAVVWTAWRLRRRTAHRRQSLAAGTGVAPASAPPIDFIAPERALRESWKSLLADGRYTEQDEAALNAKVHELGLDPDESAIDDMQGRFADLMWLSRVAMAAAGRLPTLASPSLLPKPGEIVHFESPANLTRRRSMDGIVYFDPDENGTLSITSKRVVFMGGARSLDITYRRLNGISFYGSNERIGEADLHGALVIHDTQKSSCVILGLGNADVAAAVVRAAAGKN